MITFIVDQELIILFCYATINEMDNQRSVYATLIIFNTSLQLLQ
jgi:hypothetical protein